MRNEQRYMKQIELGSGIIHIYMGLYEVKTKGAKENKKEKGETVMDSVAPDSPVCTKQSGAWSAQLSALEKSSLHQL
jgi:hypothetical protein